MAEAEAAGDQRAGPAPYGTEEEYRRAERKVLFPETDAREVYFGEHKVRLRPLPAARQILIAEIAEPVIEAFQGGEFRGAPKKILEALIEAVAVLADFYKIPGADRKWIGDTLDDGDLFTIVKTQLEAGTTNSFLRRGVRPLLQLAQETFDGIEAADMAGIRTAAANLFTDVSGEKVTSTPPSASPGGSPSPSSSSDTPKGSSS